MATSSLIIIIHRHHMFLTTTDGSNVRGPQGERTVAILAVHIDGHG